MKRSVYLTYPLALDGPRPPAIPAPELTEFLHIITDMASVQKLSLYSHVGSHLDTAAHVIEGGRHITDFSPEELVFYRPTVIDIRVPDDTVLMPNDFAPLISEIKETDFLILRLGLGMVRKNEKERYAKHSPGLSLEAGCFLVESLKNLRGIGLDGPSLACIARLDETMKVHNTMLSAHNGSFIVIEEMNLEYDLTGLCCLTVNPWLVEGMHSGPCSVIGYFSV